MKSHMKPGDVERIKEIAQRRPLVMDEELKSMIEDPRVAEVLFRKDKTYPSPLVRLVRYEGTDEFVPWSPPTD